jgi:RNA polymerase sigma-70 factor, ECF subfamily
MAGGGTPPAPSPEDHDALSSLMRRAREGSTEALDAVYARAAPRVLSFIRMRLGPSLRARLESRDILQSTLLRSFERLDQLRGDDTRSFLGWLSRIAENEIRDQVDRQFRARRDAAVEVPLDAGLDPAATGRRSPFTDVVIGEELARLERALDTLPEAQREVILLRHFQELPFAQIGARLGKSEDACRMQFARAMTALTLALSGTT